MTDLVKGSDGALNQDAHSVVAETAAVTGLSEDEIVEFLDISSRTFARRKGQVLLPAELDRLVALTELVNTTRQLTPDGSPSVSWLRSYVPAISGVPLEVARRLGGYARVVNSVAAIRWGHYL